MNHLLDDHTNTEEVAKELTICIGCSKDKDQGTLVCVDCYKYRTDVTPYKYFNGTFDQWINDLPLR